VSLPPRAVLVHRHTELEELLARHGTRGQAAFFLSTRGRNIEEVEQRHELQRRAMVAVTGSIPMDWRRGAVERADLSRFLFAPDDIIVVVGQDGLVANAAKYLDGQPVLGINTDIARNPGVLVPLTPDDAGPALALAGSGRLERYVEERTMVEARVDDGQVLQSLNEVYIGQPSHQTARYTLRAPGAGAERQASSGVLIGTGTGATGWCRSVWLERRSGLALPSPTDRSLAWFVREAWPSPATSTEHVDGLLAEADALGISVESDHLVCFGDGIEDDSLTLSWGQTVEVGVSKRRLRLITRSALR
jgi:NAD kinase